MRKMQMNGRRPVFPAALAAAAIALASCAAPPAWRGQPNWREQGIASWYGADFHGKRTANGERYDMYAMTAAHKTLPLGTWVRVTHLGTGRRIRVRVNDRGPFVAGRVIDLSYAAARALGSAEAGVVPVLVEAVLPAAAFAPPRAPGARVAHPAADAPPPLSGSFAVQLGSFALEQNARAFAARLPVPAGTAQLRRHVDNRGVWWRVRVGGYAGETDAGAAAAALGELGFDGYVVRED